MATSPRHRHRHLDRHPLRPRVRIELAAAGDRRGVRVRRCQGEVRHGLRRCVEQGDERRSFRRRLSRGRSVAAQIRHLPPSATAAQVHEVLEADGGVVIDDLADPACIAKMRSELAPYIVATPFGSDRFAGHRTRRTGALIARSPASRELIQHPLILDVTGLLLHRATNFQLHLTQTRATHRARSWPSTRSPCTLPRRWCKRWATSCSVTRCQKPKWSTSRTAARWSSRLRLRPTVTIIELGQLTDEQASSSRGYVQGWLQDERPSERPSVVCSWRRTRSCAPVDRT